MWAQEQTRAPRSLHSGTTAFAGEGTTGTASALLMAHRAEGTAYNTAEPNAHGGDFSAKTEGRKLKTVV